MSERSIAGFFRSLLRRISEEDPDTIPAAETQCDKGLNNGPNSAHNCQSGGSSGTDVTPGNDQTVNHEPSSPEDDIGKKVTQTERDTSNSPRQLENPAQHNRRLNEILSSSFEGETKPDGDAVADIEPNLAEQVVMLESRLIHKTMQLDREREDKDSMRKQIKRLQSELDQSKKTSDKQKQAIRKLTSENDKLRHDMSWFRGMRRFAETGTGDNSELMDELQSTKAKYLSLREHVIDVTSRMIGALEESPDPDVCNGDDGDETPFTVVSKARDSGSYSRSTHASGVVDGPPARNTGLGIPIIKVRRSWDRLIFKMGMLLPVRRHIYIEAPPCLVIYVHMNPLEPRDCLLNRLFGRISKKRSKLCITGLCAENSPVTGESLAHMASNAENVSSWCRHHGRYPFNTFTNMV